IIGVGSIGEEEQAEDDIYINQLQQDFQCSTISLITYKGVQACYLSFSRSHVMFLKKISTNSH
ncbi:hypothetical protein, partial [Klebsiella variicola]|uniref:hypothetical protein n=1 Tax=Klebsiella variicola TaxID=244366 RepID=UPI002731CDFE